MVFIVALTMNILAVLVSTFLLATPGKAPSAEEQRLFEEGMRAFQAGDARAADKAWRAGYQLGKDPAFLVRMGEAEEKAGLVAEAGESYRRYLHVAPDAADRAEIEQRLARLAPPTGAPAAVPADAHEVPGAFGDPGPAATPPPTPAPATPAARERARDDEVGHTGGGAEEPSGWGPLNVTAWIASGATVLLLGVSGYFAASAASNKDDVNQLLRYQNPATGEPLEYQTVAARYEKAIADGQSHDRLAKGTLIAAAGTAVVATVFFVLDAVSGHDEPLVEKRQARATDRSRTARTPGKSGTASGGPQLGLSLSPERGGTGAFSAFSFSTFSSLRWTF